MSAGSCAPGLKIRIECDDDEFVAAPILVPCSHNVGRMGSIPARIRRPRAALQLPQQLYATPAPVVSGNLAFLLTYET